ncbi:DUF3616 domain-containing protein [Actinomadura oligospora]|uniref:DUF3616 domain-containing protein n=1 Tax=Actinomadura oligospora TaxID=111804 RepID=UPI0004797B61|nr:DUF3616 domain-containing protein [Actinomadura oligospora]
MRSQRRIPLHFSDASREAATHTNLSAVRRDGPCLWVAGDETATIERLTAVSDTDGRVTGYGAELSVRLADLVDLPAGPDAEADIEGLARADGWLWAIGSHSLKRRKPKPDHSPAKARKRLASVVREENRYILARLPLTTGDDGLPRVVREDGDRTAAVLGGQGDSLADLLADDPHLAPFLAIPSKDNGLDIEGIAVIGDRVLVGLRGPVLRGWAVLVEIAPEPHSHHPGRLRVRPLDDDDGPRHRTHFLDLGGLGIRDLCPHGDDLLILTGPSMDLDGPVRLVRWPGARHAAPHGLVTADDLEQVGELPHGDGCDHAEGIAVLSDGELLVVYDSPAADRLTADGGVLADIVRLSG